MRQYLRNVYGTVWTTMLGMRITMSEHFTPAVTREYPEHHPDIPEGSRNRLHNEMGDCVVCLACANDCPVDCIHIDYEEAPKGMLFSSTSKGVPIKRNAARFDIDMSLCCFCGLCVEACPTECLTMTKDFEYATYDRTELILPFAAPFGPPKAAPKKKKRA